LISKAASLCDIAKSPVRGEHQLLGAFDAPFEDELLWRATKELLEGSGKMRLA
jgi:hypothetical protein